MQAKLVTPVIITVLFILTSVAYAQMYYTAAGSEALENNGKEWVNKILPPAVIIFSDNAGEAELKADISSLTTNTSSSPASVTNNKPNYADFRMTLGKQQITEELYSGKIFTTTGFLSIQGIQERVTAQYMLEPSGDIENGFTISLVIKLNPGDFNLHIPGQSGKLPLLLKVTSGVVDEI